MKIYFDNAATTPLHPEVIKEVSQLMASTYGNPSSSHQFGRHAKTLVEQARKSIAKHLKASANELIFTAGGTEADNLILQNAVNNLGVKRIITSAIEHHAVLNMVAALKIKKNIEVHFVKLTPQGAVDLEDLEQLLKDMSVKTLVSLMYINNEISNLLPLKMVANLCQTYGAYFHSDTVQAIGHYAIDLEEIPIDFLVASAHKFHGPKGVGFAFIRKKFGIKPLIIGGAQEHGTRAGTENVHSIAGMALALDLALENLDKDKKYVENLKSHFINQLKKLDKNITFNGLSNDLKQSSYVTLNVRFPKNIPMMLFKLDLKGIAVSGGSACQSGSDKGSHVLQAILSAAEAQKSSVRFSFSKFNTLAEVDFALLALKELLD
ncbi:MAG: cysteine desulfurase [Flavobacteriales bacterium CG_4_9_14_0_2_um_filter_35_242]|nr:cysteine desulfurase [Zetaproteobacteria bacterium]OIO09495.1 MAG: cysteine desulfurase [Flavobacteriaceae bacterium CG1_02_35_72]PIV15993.1 MAG: cysteine desulfurase [Flavobacteriales bacterium CG03_land_8_20_14_0_80_35_15]PIX07849.1 MAG: cysteine desulfurase [Flavobacteriales bacterium CG_4_8_14_3_um_filter_35_10]PJA05860.1 MAG: cysteine desulfurase [Flavobacteriales bacterium CG_4_10_14_0_2_um_filter_35_18]PJC58480.1 MAG: cysteine desulfurase [Flavobacteriales bacterium CG_4_9_14_0_2_um_